MSQVKSIMPSLYTENTKHMQAAPRYSYNYAPLDDYIVANYRGKPAKEIASDLNEYQHRVVYRTRILMQNKVIVSKKKETRLLIQKNKLMVTLADINKQLEVKF